MFMPAGTSVRSGPAPRHRRPVIQRPVIHVQQRNSPRLKGAELLPMTMKVDLMCDGADLEAFYRRYLKRCNERRLGELGQFVGEDVEVNGMVRGLRWYVDGIASVIEAFPDFHWDLRHLLVDGCWLGARLADTATTPAGRSASGSSRCTGWPAAGSSRSGVIWTATAWPIPAEPEHARGLIPAG
jgi:hypothetical protein